MLGVLFLPIIISHLSLFKLGLRFILCSWQLSLVRGVTCMIEPGVSSSSLKGFYHTHTHCRGKPNVGVNYPEAECKQNKAGGDCGSYLQSSTCRVQSENKTERNNVVKSLEGPQSLQRFKVDKWMYSQGNRSRHVVLAQWFRVHACAIEWGEANEKETERERKREIKKTEKVVK